MEIKIPKDKHALRIRHSKAIEGLKETMDLFEQVEFIQAFTGLSKPELYSVDVDDIRNVFKHITDVIATIDVSKKPTQEITINGVEYSLLNPEKLPIGWHIDYSASDFVNDPVRLACMCYIPKGTRYGQVDEHKNILYPIASRHKDFTEHFPLEEYMRLTAFFLRNYLKSIEKLTVQQRTQARINKVLNFFNGKN